MDAISIGESKVNFEFIHADLAQEKINYDEERRRLANVIQQENTTTINLSVEDAAMPVMALSAGAAMYVNVRKEFENQLINKLNLTAQNLSQLGSNANWALNNKTEFLKGISINYITTKIMNAISTVCANKPLTVCIIIFGGVVCCAVYDSTLPEEQQSTFIPKLKELIDSYISQRNQELIKKVALTPVAVVGGGVQGAFIGVTMLSVAVGVTALAIAPFAGALSVVAPSLYTSAAAAGCGAPVLEVAMGLCGGAGAIKNIGRVTSNLWEKGEIDFSDPFDESKKTQ